MPRIQPAPASRPPTGPVTDSPLFWLIVFVTMALVMSVTVQPKFARRQERLDRMHESRQRARPAVGDAPNAQGAAADEPPQPVQSWHPSRRVTLRPLTAVLAALLLAGLVAWHVTRRRAHAAARLPPCEQKDRA
jgi:hypothetical protein